MICDAAVFVATVAGAVAGLRRASVHELGLGAMWVVPEWRGRGVAGLLVASVIAWARSEGAARVGLWVPEDNARARRFYEHQGFQVTGRWRPFPGESGRFISEMSMSMTGGLLLRSTFGAPPNWSGSASPGPRLTVGSLRLSGTLWARLDAQTGDQFALCTAPGLVETRFTLLADLVVL